MRRQSQDAGETLLQLHHEIAGRRFAKPPSDRGSNNSPASGRSDGARESNSGKPPTPRSTTSPGRQTSNVAVGNGEPVCLIFKHCDLQFHLCAWK